MLLVQLQPRPWAATVWVEYEQQPEGNKLKLETRTTGFVDRGHLDRRVTRQRKQKKEIDTMTTRNVLFSLVSSGIACLLLAGVSQATVTRAFVSTTGGDANPQAVPIAQSGSGSWRPARRARLERLQHWINDHPVKTRIIETAATLAVLLGVQLLVRPSHPGLNAESVLAQLPNGRHRRWTGGSA